MAAGICSRSGQIVFVRVFHQAPLGKIDSAISAFPRHLESGQQHTFVEVDHFRYIFRPIDDNYVVLLTNKTSNILQDMKIADLFASASTNVLQNSKSDVSLSSFDLIIAYDEIYNQLGYSVFDIDSLNTILAMESHEEAVQEAILQVCFHQK